MRFVLLLTSLVLPLCLWAQDPVQWSFSSEKLDDSTHVVKLTAKIARPWHIYSQHVDEGGPVPTTISFDKNEAVVLVDSIREQGNPIEKYEPVFNMDVIYYEDSVTFVQKVKVKKKAVKATLTGSVMYMACTAEQCMPPQAVSFEIKLD